MTSKAVKKKVENQSNVNNPDIFKISPSRQIKPNDELILWTLSSGRCEMCNKYLLEHSLTRSRGKYGQNAHIVGFREKAARGKDDNRPIKINGVGNLMLLCYECHHLIDKIEPKNYPREKLENIKRIHEERIKRLTEIKPENQTTVIRMQSKIGGIPVEISESDIKLALEPYYFPREHQLNIDLTQFDDNNSGFFEVAKNEIKSRIEHLELFKIDAKPIDHISVFALAPMPLLIFLGACLNNKIRVDLYQRHRDTDDWKWKNKGRIAFFEFNQIQYGNEKQNVALILSLSGKIDISDLPKEIDKSFSIYEITLKNLSLSPMFLRLRESLDEFKEIYQVALRTIKAKHGNIKKINLFPAVPAPIAVLCGKELLHKVDPELCVYDNDKRKENKGFNLILKVKKYDR